MKTRNGWPTKTALRELCERHALAIRALDTYSYYGAFHWGCNDRNKPAAEAVAAELRAEGFEVTLEHADAKQGRTGSITIKARP